MKTRLIKVGDVNPQELSRLSQIIKGYMTAADLAAKLEVNPSTTSRILNAKISGSVNEETVVRLASLITPEMGITKEELYAANGYKEVEVPEEEDWQELTDRMSRSIQHSISRMGKIAWRYMQEARYSYKDMFRVSFDMVMESDSVKDYDRPENHLWGFTYFMTRMRFSYAGSHMDPERERRMIVSRMSMRFLERVSYYSLLYTQYNKEEYEYDDEFQALPAKVSFVVRDKEQYEYITERFKELMLPMETSLILVDLDAGKVEAEFPFKRTDGYRGIPFFDGQYFDEDDNPISEEEYENMLDELVEEYNKNDSDDE